eukprot:11195208-Lingulodinium_polyedra.AAC.1
MAGPSKRLAASCLVPGFGGNARAGDFNNALNQISKGPGIGRTRSKVNPLSERHLGDLRASYIGC